MPKQNTKYRSPAKAKPVNNVVGVDQTGSAKDARSDPSRSNS
eukprot:gene6747-9112_t